jgi:hypothetical protein
MYHMNPKKLMTATITSERDIDQKERLIASDMGCIAKYAVATNPTMVVRSTPAPMIKIGRCCLIDPSMPWILPPNNIGPNVDAVLFWKVIDPEEAVLAVAHAPARD